MKFITLLYLLFLSSTIGLSQNTLPAGDFVILENGDTLLGDIRGISETERCRRIRFFDDNNKRIKMSNQQVKLYREDEIYYVKKKIEKASIISDSIIFMKVIEYGTATIYKYSFSTSSVGISYGGGSLPMSQPMTSSSFSQYLEFNGNLTLLTRANYTILLLELTKDTKQTRLRFLNDLYKYKNTGEVVSLYNKEVSKKALK